ncbi:MAG: RNase J family beta-CASP ribonuclease [Oscillospiraceae bacterium]|jgi:ribonuclease J
MNFRVREASGNEVIYVPNQNDKKQPESSKETGRQGKSRSATSGEGAAKKAKAQPAQQKNQADSKAEATPKKRGRPRKNAQTQSAPPETEQNQPEQAKKQTRSQQSAAQKKESAQTAAKSQASAKKTTSRSAAKKKANAAVEAAPKSKSRKAEKDRGPSVRIIPLGGLGEVGKNITVIESAGESFIVDCGITFPDESMPGVDLVIPDFTYVLEQKDKIKGIFITHGHEDHIGSLPYLLKQVKFPIYATKLTIALIEGKLKEHNLLGKVQLNVVKAGDTVRMGWNSVEFINVNHSIPDACALAFHTPAGVILHTGDFKVDFTPIKGEIIDLARFGELGSKGVLALLSDSTNSERPGFAQSERTVGFSFDKLFASAMDKRIIVATFSSNVHRVQQILDAAVRYKRKVAVQGRSMENVINKALEIGYLDIPSGILVDINAANKYPPEQMVIITTGSQGEPMSALSRMAMGDHRKVSVGEQDCIIISATPIPGNEKLVTRVINELLKLGAQVVYEKMFDIHVSGHACQDEQKMMLALTRPKFFLPMHGEYKHLKKHAETAVSMGLDPKCVLIGDLGKVIEITADSIGIVDTVPSGKVLVDGLGVGDVGSVVLRDRKHLAEDGLIVVVTTVDGRSGKILAGPDIVSRGFVYVRESEDMIGRAETIAKDSIQNCISNNTREWGTLKQRVRDDLSDYFWQVTKRSPMILPVIQEIYD